MLIYLIWSTAELILDTQFLLHAQKTRKKHYVREEKLESPIGKSLFSSNFHTLLVILYKIRNGARYGDEDHSKKYNLKDFRADIRVLEEEMQTILLS